MAMMDGDAAAGYAERVQKQPLARAWRSESGCPIAQHDRAMKKPLCYRASGLEGILAPATNFRHNLFREQPKARFNIPERQTGKAGAHVPFQVTQRTPPPL